MANDRTDKLIFVLRRSNRVRRENFTSRSIM